MSRPFTGVATLPAQECHDLLTRLKHGLDAKQVTVTRHSPTPGYVYQLPRFMPQSNIAMTWDVPLVGVIYSDEPLLANWASFDTREGEQSGTVTAAAGVTTGTIPVTLTPFGTTRQLSRSVQNIVDGGEQAKWNLIEAFRPVIIKLHSIAAKGVALEMSGGAESAPVIDEIDAENLADIYLYGEQHRETPPLFANLITRACSDLRDGVGDRYTYIVNNARSAADTAVRKCIGDPRGGRIIRKFFRELGDEATVEKIQQLWAETYPDLGGISRKRIALSLSAGRSATVGQIYASSDELSFLLENNERGAR